MGLTVFSLDYLAAAVKRHGIGGSVLTLGKIDMYFGFEHLMTCAVRHGFIAQTNGKAEIPEDSALGKLIRGPGVLSELKHMREHGSVSDKAVFAALGFETLRSVDASDFEGADYVHDLNNPGLRDVTGRDFDLVIDAGTMEHVFNIPNAFANIQSVVTVGGCILHSSPTNNSVDHGFYQFSPTLFYDYYRANEWEVLQLDLTRYERTDSAKFLNEPPGYFNYTPGSLNMVSQGGLDEKMYGTWALVRRTASSTIGVVPTQGLYAREWTRSRTD